jgi:hypothetical protein
MFCRIYVPVGLIHCNNTPYALNKRLGGHIEGSAGDNGPYLQQKLNPGFLARKYRF